MEYKILTPDDPKYPKRLKERLGNECPPQIYYNGPLEFLDKYTMAVISSDSITGMALFAAMRIMDDIRDYEMNFIGGWQSAMETEFFRIVGLYRKNDAITLTLFTAKGIAVETFDNFLLERFYPPFHKFAERDEYFRRVKDGELLMLSIVDPNLTRHIRRNIMERSWILCNLADIVFVGFADKGSKTYTTVKRLLKKTNIPLFTSDDKDNIDLHQLGVPGFNRKNIRKFLEEKGAKLPTPKESEWVIKPEDIDSYIEATRQKWSPKKAKQAEMIFDKGKKSKYKS